MPSTEAWRKITHNDSYSQLTTLLVSILLNSKLIDRSVRAEAHVSNSPPDSKRKGNWLLIWPDNISCQRYWQVIRLGIFNFNRIERLQIQPRGWGKSRPSIQLVGKVVGYMIYKMMRIVIIILIRFIKNRYFKSNQYSMKYFHQKNSWKYLNQIHKIY